MENILTNSYQVNLIDNILPISVLCCSDKNIYQQFPYVFPWDAEMNAYNFNNSTPVITHAPCAQWSKMRSFAKVNLKEKDLAFFCLQKVIDNGGIFEHPAGSAFFKYVNAKHKIISINQHWFGFPSQKRTHLYFNRCVPGQLPLNFNAVEQKTMSLSKFHRSHTNLTFASWLISSVRDSFQF